MNLTFTILLLAVVLQLSFSTERKSAGKVDQSHSHAHGEYENEHVHASAAPDGQPALDKKPTLSKSSKTAHVDHSPKQHLADQQQNNHGNQVHEQSEAKRGHQAALRECLMHVNRFIVVEVQLQLAELPKWAQASIAIAVISLAPNMLMLVLPFDSNGRGTFLRLSLAFASGSLLGDALLHLIPHSIMETKVKLQREAAADSQAIDVHDLDERASVRVGGFVLLGILLFLIMERVIRLFGSSYAHNDKEHPDGNAVSSIDRKRGSSIGGTRKLRQRAAKTVAVESITRSTKTNSDSKEPTSSRLSVATALNLLADVGHNFTDGLAIGAAFAANMTLGLSTTASVFFHELPHELGDIAILVLGGFSKGKACALQFVTAGGSMAGCALALQLEGTYLKEFILPLTAGGFIYISTASVLPELLNSAGYPLSAPGSAKTNRNATSRLSLAFSAFIEILFAFSGIAVMYAMSAVDVHSHEH